jgi:hypothetical protein
MVMPLYQKAGVQLAAIPQMTTVGIQESARTAQSLSSALDRLSSFAFKQAEIKAQVEGKEYGAINAPTKEQIEDAKKSGEDISTVLPGDKTTVFGRAARATAIDSLSLDMEMSARKEIATLQAQFEAGTIGLNEMQSSLESLSKTHQEILNQVSPLAAQKFAASIGVISNSAYLAAAKDMAAQNKKDEKISILESVQTFIRDVETIVKAGPTEDPLTKETLTPDEKVEIARQQIATLAKRIDDPDFFNTKIKELDQAVSNAKINVVMSQAMESPGKGLLAIRGRAKFDDKEIQAVFDSMSVEEKNQAYVKMQAALSQENSLAAQAEAASERRKTKQSAAKESELLAAISSNDIDEQDRILEELKKIDNAKYNSYFKAINIDGGYDDRQVVEALEFSVIQGTLTREAVNDARSERKISSATYVSLLSKIANRDDETYNEAMRIVKGDIGLPDKPFANADIIDRGAQQKVAQIERELILARRADPSLDAISFVLPRIQKVKDDQADAKARNKARSALAQAQRRFDRDGSKGLTATALLEAARNASYPTESAKKAAIEGLELYIRLEDEAQ